MVCNGQPSYIPASPLRSVVTFDRSEFFVQPAIRHGHEDLHWGMVPALVNRQSFRLTEQFVERLAHSLPQSVLVIATADDQLGPSDVWGEVDRIGFRDRLH